MSAQAGPERLRPHEIYEQISHQIGPTSTRTEDCVICLDKIEAEDEALAHTDGKCLNAWHVGCLEAELQASELRTGHARCPNCRASLANLCPDLPSSISSLNALSDIPTTAFNGPEMIRTDSEYPGVWRRPSYSEPEIFLSREVGQLRRSEVLVPGHSLNELLPSRNMRLERFASMSDNVERRIYREGEDEHLVRGWHAALVAVEMATSIVADPAFYARAEWELGRALVVAVDGHRSAIADWPNLIDQIQYVMQNQTNFDNMSSEIVHRTRAAVAYYDPIRTAYDDIGPDPYEDADQALLDGPDGTVLSAFRADELRSYWDVYDRMTLISWWHYQVLADILVSTLYQPSLSRELADQLRRTLEETDAVDRANSFLLRTRPFNRALIAFVSPESRIDIENQNLPDSDIMLTVYNRNWSDYQSIMNGHIINAWLRIQNGSTLSQDQVNDDDDEDEMPDGSPYTPDLQAGNSFTHFSSPDPEEEAELSSWLSATTQEGRHPSRILQLHELWDLYDHGLSRTWYDYQISADELVSGFDDPTLAFQLDLLLYQDLNRAERAVRINNNLTGPFDMVDIEFFSSDRRDKFLEGQAVRLANGSLWSDNDTLFRVGWWNQEDFSSSMQAHLEAYREKVSALSQSDIEVVDN